MKISCAQVSLIWDDVDEAFERADEFAASSDADMIVFSEQYATGWRASGSAAARSDVKERWLSLAEKYNKCIVGSYQRVSESGKPENTMLICAPDGSTLAEYSKIHLFSPGGEDRNFSAGRAPVTFEFGGLKFGCAVCFDLRFPELFREYMRAGCHAVVIHSAWPAARISDWELLIRARALENRMYVIGCNCIGFDSVCGTDYCGRSIICDYNGKIIDDAGVFEGECSIDADADDLRDDVLGVRRRWGLI